MLDILLAYRLVRAVPRRRICCWWATPTSCPRSDRAVCFADILKSEAVPQMHLTELFRQARESAIIVTAHGVNAGEMPALKGDPNERLLLPARRRPARRATPDRRSRRPAPARALRLRSGARHSGALADVSRRRRASIALNEALQARLNADASGPWSPLATTRCARATR